MGGRTAPPPGRHTTLDCAWAVTATAGCSPVARVVRHAVQQRGAGGATNRRAKQTVHLLLSLRWETTWINLRLRHCATGLGLHHNGSTCRATAAASSSSLLSRWAACFRGRLDRRLRSVGNLTIRKAQQFIPWDYMAKISTYLSLSWHYLDVCPKGCRFISSSPQPSQNFISPEGILRATHWDLSSAEVPNPNPTML